MVKSMLFFRLLICTAILPFVINILFSQSFNIKGQFWGSRITGDDAYLENGAMQVIPGSHQNEYYKYLSD